MGGRARVPSHFPRFHDQKEFPTWPGKQACYGRRLMADSSSTQADPSARPAARSAAAAEGSRVVSPDYGMPGSKGIDSPIKPLLWLLLPFFFCVTYGILTR